MNDESFERMQTATPRKIVDTDTVQMVGTPDYLSAVWAHSVRDFSHEFAGIETDYQIDFCCGVLSVKDAVSIVHCEGGQGFPETEELRVDEAVEFLERLEREEDNIDQELVVLARGMLRDWLQGDE